MKFVKGIICFLVFTTSVVAQTKIERTLKKLNNESVPYIMVDSLSRTSDAILLDTRKKEEYDVSHLENAIWVGYQEFKIDSVLAKIPNSESEIVVKTKETRYMIPWEIKPKVFMLSINNGANYCQAEKRFTILKK